MKVIFTFNPPAEIKNDLKTTFSEIDFFYYQNVDAARDDLKNAEVIVTYGEDLYDDHICSAEKLKWIMVTSAGLELIPLAKIKERNILVTNARGIHKIPMAEFTMGLLLEHAKNFRLLWKNQQIQKWDKGIPINELHHQTLLIIGAGAIGQEIARLAKAFGMNVVGVNSKGNICENFDAMYTLKNCEKAISEADYMVSVLPSTAKTVNFFKKKHFQRMKKTAVFINLGRGDVVDEAVLMDALENNEFAHAYLDVFQTEPLPSENRLWKMENVTITPHISSTTKNYLPRSIEIFKANLHTYSNKNNHFVNLIDPERGY